MSQKNRSSHNTQLQWVAHLGWLLNQESGKSNDKLPIKNIKKKSCKWMVYTNTNQIHPCPLKMKPRCLVTGPKGTPWNILRYLAHSIRLMLVDDLLIRPESSGKCWTLEARYPLDVRDHRIGFSVILMLPKKIDNPPAYEKYVLPKMVICPVKDDTPRVSPN